MSNFSDKLWSEIRKEFGIHCIRQRDIKKAKQYFEESLAVDAAKLDSVFHLTNAQAKVANTEHALRLLNQVSVAQPEHFNRHFKCNLQECDTNYEQNLFEKSLSLAVKKAHSLQREEAQIPKATLSLMAKQKDAKLKGPKIGALRQRSDLIRVNLDDTIGKNAGNCLFDHRKFFDKITDERRMNADKVTMASQRKSRVLTLNEDCDVVSLQEEEEKEKSIKESHRQKRLKRFFAQCYMQSAWQDFEFINGLKSNKILAQSTQNAESFASINREIDDCTKQIAKFISQLHARCPLYAYRRRMFSSPEHRDAVKRVTKLRMQIQTQRDTSAALKNIRKLRCEGKLRKLIEIAEHELGFHFQIKPEALMPRRNEITEEICNLIGLAYLDRLKMPTHIRGGGLANLAEVFEVSIDNKRVAPPYIFGQRSTYRDPAQPDTSFLVFKANMNRLESRVKFSTMAVEKCYLYHEMGRFNLRQSKFDESRKFGRKIIDEAEMMGRSYLWKILGQILIVRANVMQRNYIKIHESLIAAQTTVIKFGNNDLTNLLENCIKLSQQIQQSVVKDE